jgi:hypothetical protein
MKEEPSPSPHFLRGRATSSPPQFGHTLPIDVAHDSQNVHSYVQMNARPVSGVAAWQLSHSARISNAIAPLRAS